jgi:hypothetical protein
MASTDGDLANEAQLSNEMSRGTQAREILEHDLMREAFEVIEAKAIKEWKSNESLEGREKCHLMLKAMEQLKGHLSEVMLTGRLASLQLEARRNRIQKLKEWISDF